MARPSIFDTDYRPYGTYEGPPGDSDQWRAAFGEAMSLPEAEDILGDNSPWAILGIKVGASGAEIKQAFRNMALKHHPDQGGNAEMFKKVRAAYTKLGEPR